MTMKETYLSMGIGEKTYEFCEKIEQDLKERFCEIDKVAEQNQMKVLGAMQKNHVSEACFAATTGYGYNDMGRETLEQVYAEHMRLRLHYLQIFVQVMSCFHLWESHMIRLKR